jgi:hypothetical protein
MPRSKPAADAAQILTAIDEDVLAAYHAALAEQATVAAEPPTIIESVAEPANYHAAAVDHGTWTSEGGMVWESDREALAQRVIAERRANMGNHRADGPTSLAESQPMEEITNGGQAEEF